MDPEEIQENTGRGYDNNEGLGGNLVQENNAQFEGEQEFDQYNQDPNQMAQNEKPERIGSDNSFHVDRIIDDISRLFNQYNYIGLNTIKFHKAKNLRKFAKHYVLRLFYSDNTLMDDLKNFKKTTILNIKELSSIIHFPH